MFQSQKSSSAGKSNLITLTIWHKKLAFLHTWWWSSSWVLVVIRPCFNRNHIPKPLFFSLCLFLQDLRDSWDGVFLIYQPEKVTLLVCVFCALIFLPWLLVFVLWGWWHVMKNCQFSLFCVVVAYPPISLDLFKLPEVVAFYPKTFLEVTFQYF